MRIGVLMGLFPKNIRAEIEAKSSGPVQYAADTLQWNIVKGLDAHQADYTIINSIYIGSYPKRYKDLQVKAFDFSHNDRTRGHNLGFVNLPLYKLYSRYYQNKKFLQQWVGKEREVLIVYAIHTPFILAAIKAKEKNPALRICLVVPDLPEFMADKRNLLMSTFKKVEKKILDKALLKVDAFVLLSKYMVDALAIGERPWACVEGIYSPPDQAIEAQKDPEKISVLYSGILMFKYGLENLLNAFEGIKDPNYELWICGEGDAKADVIKRASEDHRIKFLGQLPREAVLVLQAKATMLVNPRTAEGEFTKYSFPSKTMEYLASGTPTIIHQLPGIPEEYLPFCFVAKNETAAGLREMMVQVGEKSAEERAAFGDAAKKFILENKTAKQQVAKILALIEQLK